MASLLRFCLYSILICFYSVCCVYNTFYPTLSHTLHQSICLFSPFCFGHLFPVPSIPYKHSIVAALRLNYPLSATTTATGGWMFAMRSVTIRTYTCNCIYAICCHGRCFFHFVQLFCLLCLLCLLCLIETKTTAVSKKNKKHKKTHKKRDAALETHRGDARCIGRCSSSFVLLGEYLCRHLDTSVAVAELEGALPSFPMSFCLHTPAQRATYPCRCSLSKILLRRMREGWRKKTPPAQTFYSTTRCFGASFFICFFALAQQKQALFLHSAASPPCVAYDRARDVFS